MRGPVAVQPLYMFFNLIVEKRRIVSAITDTNESHVWKITIGAYIYSFFTAAGREVQGLRESLMKMRFLRKPVQCRKWGFFRQGHAA